MRVVYLEKFPKNFPDLPVQCANWSGHSSKVAWLAQAVLQLQGRPCIWLDDAIGGYAKKIEELKLSKTLCIQVTAKGAGALTELRDDLERFTCPEVVAAMVNPTNP